MNKLPDDTRERPDWWPTTPYHESIFPMARERYAEIVPDPEVRTALSGMLGRHFWRIAEETIWERFCQAIEAGLVVNDQ